jgi:hypothetical protein
MSEPRGAAGTELPDDLPGLVFLASEIGDDWAEAKEDLTAAFELARQAATDTVSIVFIVRNDDLLGRKGAGRAMVAAGLVSGARTAALEGAAKGWTANVIVHDASVNLDSVLEQARFVLANGLTTGEVIHMGPGHVGKALV